MTTTEKDTVAVGLGELRVSKNPSDVLTCLGLGSCIGFSAYDPVARVGGLAHIVLPSSEGRSGGAPAKFADKAVPLLIEEMVRMGAVKSRMQIKIAGGAQMSLVPGKEGIFKTGEKNVEATHLAVIGNGLKIATADVGGHSGRTLRLYVDSGKVTVTVAGTRTLDL